MNVKLVTLIAIFACARARGLRLKNNDGTRSCDLAVNAVGGSATIKVDPDILIITAEVRGLSAAAVGVKAAELKAKVSEGSEAATYEQTFRQDTVWNPNTRQSEPAHWVASAKVTLPYKAAGGGKDGGLDHATKLISQILKLAPAPTPTPAIDSCPRAAPCYNRHTDACLPKVCLPPTHAGEEGGYRRLGEGYGEGYAEETSYADPAYATTPIYTAPPPFGTLGGCSCPVGTTDVWGTRHAPGSSGSVSISVTRTTFDISDGLRETTEKAALSLAVKDAIARIGETARPFLGDGYSATEFGPSSLSNVKIGAGHSGGRSYGNTPAAGFALAMARGENDAATFVEPGKHSVTQSATVAACVHLP